jgi:hypothetical protein
MSKVVFSALAVGAFAWLTGCGTSSTAVSVDSGTATDGSSGGAGDSSAAADSSADAGPNCHPVGVTQTDCRSCCEKAFPTGSNSFDTYLLQCACAGEYCGPLEGGAPEAGSDDAGDAGPSDAAVADGGASPSDGGTYGNAVCTATCNGQAFPDTVCNDCLNAAIGSVNSAGPCQSHVLALCLGDMGCNQYLGCVENCP